MLDNMEIFEIPLTIYSSTIRGTQEGCIHQNSLETQDS